MTIRHTEWVQIELSCFLIVKEVRDYGNKKHLVLTVRGDVSDVVVETHKYKVTRKHVSVEPIFDKLFKRAEAKVKVLLMLGATKERPTSFYNGESLDSSSLMGRSIRLPSNVTQIRGLKYNI